MNDARITGAMIALLSLALGAAIPSSAAEKDTDPKSAAAQTPAKPELKRKKKLSAEQLEKLRKLIVQLGSDSWEKREAAGKAIAKLGPGAIPELRKALKSKDPEVVSRAQDLIASLTPLDTKPATAADRKAEALLKAQTVSFEFVQAPLSEAINFLRQIGRVRFETHASCAARGKTPITLKMRQTSMLGY